MVKKTINSKPNFFPPIQGIIFWALLIRTKYGIEKIAPTVHGNWRKSPAGLEIIDLFTLPVFPRHDLNSLVCQQAKLYTQHALFCVSDASAWLAAAGARLTSSINKDSSSGRREIFHQRARIAGEHSFKSVHAPVFILCVYSIWIIPAAHARTHINCTWERERWRWRRRVRARASNRFLVKSCSLAGCKELAVAEHLSEYCGW